MLSSNMSSMFGMSSDDESDVRETMLYIVLEDDTAAVTDKDAVVTEKDAVVINTADLNDMQAEQNLIWDYILPALK